MTTRAEMADVLRRVTEEAGGDWPDAIYIGDTGVLWRRFWQTTPPPSDDDRKGEPLLVIWGGKVRMASWCTAVSPPNWQEWPDGDFSRSDDEVSAWAFPEYLLPETE